MSYECGVCELPRGMCECKASAFRERFRITDKMRLDWLNKITVDARCSTVWPSFRRGVTLYPRLGDIAPSFTRKTLRQAIDAAIKAERRRKPSRLKAGEK